MKCEVIYPDDFMVMSSKMVIFMGIEQWKLLILWDFYYQTWWFDGIDIIKQSDFSKRTWDVKGQKWVMSGYQAAKLGRSGWKEILDPSAWHASTMSANPHFVFGYCWLNQVSFFHLPTRSKIAVLEERYWYYRTYLIDRVVWFLFQPSCPKTQTFIICIYIYLLTHLFIYWLIYFFIRYIYIYIHIQL